MEEKDSEISGPCEEFRICFCGEVPSGSVAWYCIDVSEKTESSTKKLNSFSETEHFPSVYYAFLKGCIYSLGGHRSGRTLLNDVWILDIKSLDSFAARGEEKLKEPEKPQKRLKQKLKEAEKPEKRLKLTELKFGQPKDPGKFDMLRKIEMGTADPGLKKAAADAALKKAKAYAAKKVATAEEAAAAAAAAKEAEAAKAAAMEAAAKAARTMGGVTVDTLLDFLCLERESPKEPEFLTEPLGLRWIRGPPMTFARCNPHTMVVDQKLYVLGGFEPNQNQADGWIEVFDPKEKKWESLPSPPDQIHSSVMISGLLKAKKEIIIAKQLWDRHPMSFYSYNIMTRCWNPLVPHESEASVHLPPNAGRAVTVGNTLYWISTEEHNHECIILAYDLDRNMWFEDHLNTATIFGRREHFSSIYSSRPGFLHLRDQKFCLLLQSSITKDDPESSIEYLYCVILDISPIYEHEDRGKFELTIVSFQKYSMDRYINFLDCMLGVSGVKSVDRRQCTSTNISIQEMVERSK
nr:uncharacterized protein LOC112032213 isoform X2 [Quercus suber]POF00008.1 f-box/kelch-repeat protein [Quercus suber]